MNIPLEIWIQISYHLELYALLICNKFISIYDESWFKHKLLSLYPDCNTNNDSWKNLYSKSLKSGNIYECKDDCILKKCFSMEGVKVSHIRGNLYIVLTFDQKVWSNISNDGETWEQKLIDVNVNDIDGNLYIKGNKLYYINFYRNDDILASESKLIVEAETDFISLLHLNSCYAITRNKFYYTRNYKRPFKIFDCTYASKLIYYSYELILVQYEDDEIEVLNPWKSTFHKLNIPNIKNIYPSIAKTVNGDLIHYVCSWKGEKLISNSEIINSKMTNLTEAINSSSHILLIDGSIYKLNKLELKYITANVKNICRDDYIIM